MAGHIVRIYTLDYEITFPDTETEEEATNKAIKKWGLIDVTPIEEVSILVEDLEDVDDNDYEITYQCPKCFSENIIGITAPITCLDCGYSGTTWIKSVR